jgi:predicted PurR-regulated permease PerM
MAANLAPKLLSATADAIVDIFVLYFMLYFMLANARRLEIFVRKFLPFKLQNNQLLLTELRKQTIANSVGIPSLAIVTGLVATLGYWIFGISDPWLWGTLTGIATVVPAIGVGLLWVPIAVYLFLSGHSWSGVGLALYCIIVFTVVENGFRIAVLKRLGDTHPLITFFGVLVGLEIFGFVGIIFGPLLISYFILLVKIYRSEYLNEGELS